MMPLPEDQLLAHLAAGAVWATAWAATRSAPATTTASGDPSRRAEVTDECEAAHRAGLARSDGLLWHRTEAGPDRTAATASTRGDRPS